MKTWFKLAGLPLPELSSWQSSIQGCSTYEVYKNIFDQLQLSEGIEISNIYLMEGWWITLELYLKDIIEIDIRNIPGKETAYLSYSWSNLHKVRYQLQIFNYKLYDFVLRQYKSGNKTIYIPTET